MYAILQPSDGPGPGAPTSFLEAAVLPRAGSDASSASCCILDAAACRCADQHVAAASDVWELWQPQLAAGQQGAAAPPQLEPQAAAWGGGDRDGDAASPVGDRWLEDSMPLVQLLDECVEPMRQLSEADLQEAALQGPVLSLPAAAGDDAPAADPDAPAADLQQPASSSPPAAAPQLLAAHSSPAAAAAGAAWPVDSCRECMARLPQGAALHQRVWSPGKDAGLGEDVVAWLVGATTSCESCNSSSSSTRREPCVCVTSEQLCDGSTAFGVQWVKQRLNPHGQKRAANGVKVPRVFNWSANAPTQLQQPEVLWGLLDGNSSSASASGAAATTSSSSGSHPQLLTIRSKAPGAIAFALACHDSSQCEACAASDAPAAAQSGSLAPDASYWNSSITCHKMALGLKHHTLLLYDRVFVSVCSSNEEAGVPAGQPVAANNSKRAKQPRS